jgi:sulfide:quinone oxidoreductase
MGSKTILILGGGIGGLVAAEELHRRLGGEHQVVLIDRNREHFFAPSFLGVMTGARDTAQATLDLERRLTQLGTRFVQTEVKGIDTQTKQVATSGGAHAYDYLILALGAELAPELMPGFAEAAYTPYDLAEAARLRDVLPNFDGGQVPVVVSSMPFKCPAAPYETALLLEDYFRQHGLRDRIEMTVFTPEQMPMGVAGPEVGHAVVDMLTDKEIHFKPGSELTEIDPEGKRLLFANREPVAFDLLVGIPPHRAPAVVRQAGLANQAGWVEVDNHTLATSAPDVYAIGDITFIKIPNGKRLPLAGVFAHGQAQCVARTIFARIQGGTEARFDGLGYCWVEMGSGVAGFASGEFYTVPDPVVDLRQPSRWWKEGKTLFERWWLGEGLIRGLAGLCLRLGSKLMRVPVEL